MDEPSGQQIIALAINSNKPFFIGRIAGIELQIAHCILNDSLYNHNVKELENNAGIKVNDYISLLTYVDRLIESYQHCTHIAEWDGPVYAITGKGQDLIRHKVPDVPRLHARHLEPYYYKESWMSAMKGKRILIVHPFSLESQVPRLNNIFPHPWFEDCTFIFFKPPVTFVGNHEGKDWQEHYNASMSELQKIHDFDIALVAAGGYGMLISDFIYTTLGKSVMYIRVALQIFFGVIGKRWFENQEILAMMNDNWIRPIQGDKPANFTAVEKGCYW